MKLEFLQSQLLRPSFYFELGQLEFLPNVNLSKQIREMIKNTKPIYWRRAGKNLCFKPEPLARRINNDSNFALLATTSSPFAKHERP